MTSNRGNQAAGPAAQERQLFDDGRSESSADDAATEVPPDSREAILRQIVALRSDNAADDQLALLVRMVDSATWAVSVSLTVLVDGVLLQGALVPSEVSATFLDETLQRAAESVVEQLRQASKQQPDDPSPGTLAVRLRQAQAFLQRVARRPFSAAQLRTRQRNASALVQLGEWHSSHGQRPANPLDIPGSYADPSSHARNVVQYTAGQRSLTLVEAKMFVGGSWLALKTPVRVSLGRVSTWTLDG